MMERFWHAFVPLFIAFDGVGLLPVFWQLSHRLSSRQRQRAATEAVATAFLVAAVFLWASRPLFRLMGLELADVMVAGGSILFVLSLRELLMPGKSSRIRDVHVGVVPVGVPLLAGPAVLTMTILVRERYGWGLAVAALVANMLVIWALLQACEWLMRRLGRDGSQVISKITSLILTAFGIMLMREGIGAMLNRPLIL
ncbi:MAG: MarC family protein [Candidatus Omnitrophica bacterium]|nr:MarC family protein [Candidatus Omnitrophota bacterium]